MTIEQLAVKVMSKLGIYDGSPLEPKDLQNATDAYNGVWYALNDDGLVTWDISAEDIPDRFQLPLTSLIAAELAPFYYQNDVPPQVKQAYVNMIRRQLASGQDVETVQAEYF
jgi:hypothetical protein